nr:hypothetical protein [Aeromicrobium sp.]
MIRQRVSLAVAGAVVATTALTAGMVSPASAAITTSPYDPGFEPGSTDLVGVGSDTIEIVMHDVANAFNQTAAASTGKIASFAAAPAGEIVPRTGVTAITRPNGSGSGKNLLHATTNNPAVDFARSSSSLSTAENSDGLKQFAFAVDGLKLAVSSTVATHAPSTITAADMVNIYKGSYKTWGEIPGYDGSAPGATIKPYVPQAGSGTLSFFQTQLQAANGGAPVVLAATVGESQEHDPALIRENADAIAPFSTARAEGLTSVKLVRGFSARRAVYNVVRGSDIAVTTPGSKGAKLLDVFGPSGYLCSPAAKTVIEAAGFDQLATSSTQQGGQCGQALSTAVSYPFVTTSTVTTETALTATSAGSTVTLSAAIDGNNIAVGTVTFKEGATVVGTAPVNGQSKATLTLNGVAKGNGKKYTATYTPTAGSNFEGSEGSATVNVVAASAVSLGAAGKTFGVAGTIPLSVSAAGVPASGTVSVNVGGSVSNVALSNGAAVISVPATLGAGSYQVTVSYGGDAANNVGPSSASSTLSISKAKTTSTMKLSKSKVKANKKAKATVTVKISGSSLKASGKVTLKAGSKTVGKGTVRNGKATITLKKLRKGTYKIKATFAGGGNYGPSKTKTLKLKVVK